MEQEDQIRRDQQKQDDEMGDVFALLSCFQRNSPTSACPNAAKGIFVNLEEARGFLKGQ